MPERVPLHGADILGLLVLPFDAGTGPLRLKPGRQSDSQSKSGLACSHGRVCRLRGAAGPALGLVRLVLYLLPAAQSRQEDVPADAGREGCHCLLPVLSLQHELWPAGPPLPAAVPGCGSAGSETPLAAHSRLQVCLQHGNHLCYPGSLHLLPSAVLSQLQLGRFLLICANSCDKLASGMRCSQWNSCRTRNTEEPHIFRPLIGLKNQPSCLKLVYKSDLQRKPGHTLLPSST